MSETVRVLVPDHLDLVGVINKAIEFAAELHLANDPTIDRDGDPWRLPDQLVDAELQAALEAITAHSWRFDVGHDTAGRDTAIPVNHSGTGHMGVYVTTATRPQLTLLTAALQLMVQAETTRATQRLPALGEVTQFVDLWTEIDEHDDADASLSDWRTVVRILGLAIAAAPSARGDRPARLYVSEGTDARLVPTAAAEGTSPAVDTAVVLARFDAGDGRSIDLDGEAWEAWQRLTAEWHGAVYGVRSDSHDALLSSWAY